MHCLLALSCKCQADWMTQNCGEASKVVGIRRRHPAQAVIRAAAACAAWTAAP